MTIVTSHEKWCSSILWRRRMTSTTLNCVLGNKVTCPSANLDHITNKIAFSLCLSKYNSSTWLHFPVAQLYIWSRTNYSDWQTFSLSSANIATYSEAQQLHLPPFSERLIPFLHAPYDVQMTAISTWDGVSLYLLQGYKTQYSFLPRRS